MTIIQLILSGLAFLSTLVFFPLFFVVLILGVIGIINKNYLIFKRWGKYLLWNIVIILILVTAWALIAIGLNV